MQSYYSVTKLVTQAALIAAVTDVKKGQTKLKRDKLNLRTLRQRFVPFIRAALQFQVQFPNRFSRPR